MRAFLGLPLHVGGQLVGMAGLSNREGGYDEGLMEALGPLVSAAGYMIMAARERKGRVAAEVAMNRNELLRHSVVETALDCVIAIDHDGMIIEFNPAAEKTYGWTREEVMGKSLAEVVIPPHLRQAHADGMAKYLESGEGPVIGQRIEVPSIRRDGTEFPIELAITVAEFEDNPVFTAYLRDITERRKAEEELKGARATAEAANRAKSAFVATVSHEIRTPINAIMGALGLLDGAELEAGDRRFLATAHRSADTLLGLVNDVLDLSRIDADRLPLEVGQTRPMELCDGVMHLLSERAAARGNRLGAVVNKNVPETVAVDSGKVRQVLINLVGNSIKFTQDGDIRVDVSARDDELRFSVTDTGVGISEDDIPNLFTEFSQFGDARERGGAGLGLAISKRLIEMMGGRISARSVLGEGSRFEFRIPVRTEVAATPVRVEGASAALVVGRGEFFPAVMRDQCEAWGISTRIVGSVDQAVDVISSGETLDFVLLCLERLPSTDESAANGLLAAAAARRRLPLGLAVSGGQDCIDCLRDKLRADMSVSLPIINEDLVSGIKAMVSGEKESEAPWAHRTLVGEQDHPGIRVLLADDSQANRLVMAEMLRRAGFEVDVVADGAEAVQAVRSLPYDVVLMDIEMPEMDGLDATRAIRELAGTGASVPVVALTANVLADSRERFLAAGMNDYVTKPVDRPTLAATVLKWAETGTADLGEPGSDVGEGPLVDDDALQALGEDTSFELIPRMVGVFVEELQSRASHIAEGVETHDSRRLASEAHALKSSAATYGAVAIAEHARRLDQACKDGNQLEAEAQARAILARVGPTVGALREHPLVRQ